MKLLWITWKDSRHPQAGGAELVTRELCQRLLAEGNEVTMLTCGYSGAASHETLDGIQIIRIGKSRYLHSFQALAYYVRRLRGQFDVLIEEVNGGAPYFSVLFADRARKFMFYHQLARINWLYEIKRPFSYLGYYGFVPLATRLVSLSRAPVITVSESTRAVLAQHGLRHERTHIISEGLEIEPAKRLAGIRKFDSPTVLSLGAMRAMKRTLDHITAFEIAKKQLPNLHLKVAGRADGSYGEKVLARLRQSPYADDIVYLGSVSQAQKIDLMRKSHLILQTAVEEGWGLTVTEAASQGTPAVVYDVSGLRDSVRNGETGIVTAPHPDALAEGIVGLLADNHDYERLRRNGWEWSKEITFDHSYQDFKQLLEAA